MLNRLLPFRLALLGCIVVAISFYFGLWPLELVVSQANEITFALLLVFLFGLYLTKNKVPSEDTHHLERASAIYMYTLTFLFLFIMLNLQSPWKAPPLPAVETETASALVSYATYNKLYTNNSLDAA